MRSHSAAGVGPPLFFFIVVLLPFSSIGLNWHVRFRKERPGDLQSPGYDAGAHSRTNSARRIGPTVLAILRADGEPAGPRLGNIVLSGTEQANRQGRHAYVYQHVFHQTVLFHTYATDRDRAGESRFVFPMETMHSFHSIIRSSGRSTSAQSVVASDQDQVPDHGDAP